MRYIIALLTPLILVISYYFFKIRTDLGFDTEFEPLGEEKCSRIDLPLAPEDMVGFHGKAISALDDKRVSMFTTMSAAKAKRGQLVEIDIDALEFRSIPIENFPSDLPFNPHGIYLLGEELYIVNHCYSDIGDQIEVFQLSFSEGKTSAKYLRSIKFGVAYNGMINDIAVSDSRDLYVTIFKIEPDLPEGKHPSSFFRDLKIFVGTFIVPMTKLLSCKVESEIPVCTEEDRGYIFNGVTRRHDQIVAADTLARVLHIYEIQATGRLKKVRSVNISYPLDNIDYSPDLDEIYGAGGIRVKEFFEAVGSIENGEEPRFIAGHAYKVNFKEEIPLEESLFRGNMLSAPSCAIRIGDKIVLGSSITPAIAVCKL